MKLMAENLLYTLAGGGLLCAMLTPHVHRLEEKAYRSGWYHGVRAGKAEGMRYVDSLIAEGWTCEAAAYVTPQGERIGLVCTNGHLTKILYNEAMDNEEGGA